MFRQLSTLAVLASLTMACCSAVADDVPVDLLRAAAHVTPAPKQIAYQKMEQNLFVHFGMSTFVDKPGDGYLGWGDGTESPNLFNPTALNADQWASVAKNAGMKTMILTAKHHDGFALWPSAYTDYDVASSSWRGGQGDVVREAADAAAAAGLKFGIYLSPWDRHEGSGTPGYNTFYQNQLTELLTNYGDIAEVWFDGFGPDGTLAGFDWTGAGNKVHQLQPNAMLFSANPSGDADIAGPINESGYARSSQWSVIADRTPATDALQDAGDRKYLVGAQRVEWYPGEFCFTSRPNWFYRANEDDQVKTPQQMEDIYYASVGQNAVSLVGLPPDRRGLIHENDIAAVNTLHTTITRAFRVNLAKGKTATANSVGGAHTADLAFDGDEDTYWTTANGVVPTEGANAATLEIDLGEMTTFDRIALQEMISEGQRVEHFILEAWNGYGWYQFGPNADYTTTIGYKGLERFPEITTSKVRLTILDSRDVPMINEFGLFYSLTPVPEPSPLVMLATVGLCLLVSRYWRRRPALFAVLASLTMACCSAVADDVPVELLRKAAHVTPTPQQLAWQETEFNCFVHFNMNTFTDITDCEHCTGKEDPALFNPTAFDANQWVSVCKDAGMKMIVLTAKHHDGFCLWPSKYTEHSVKNSPWRGGKGDVVKEAADACRRGGIKFGIYVSPWDLHEKTYGTDAYNDFYKNQLRELLTNYGEIAEVWWDGYCPEPGKQTYDWEGYKKVVRELQPNALIFGMGPDPDISGPRSESGYARSSQWSVIADKTTEDYALPDLGDRKYLLGAKKIGWHPVECCLTIRPHWFYRSSEDEKVKSLKQLLDIYYGSVGQNAVSLLGLPPDRRGLIHENDAARVRELRSVLDETFKTNLATGKSATASSASGEHTANMTVDGKGDTYWTPADGAIQASLEIDLGQPVAFDRAMLQEMIATGQRVEQFKLEAWDGQEWKEFAQATTIGHKRLMRFPAVTASKVRLAIVDARDCPTIREFGLFKASAREKE